MPQLPEHTIRMSARARSARLVISPREGLVVVVPRDFDQARVPELLERHSRWIQSASARSLERRLHLASARGPLPAVIDAPSVGRSWSVSMCDGGHSGVVARERGDAVVLRGCVSDEAACRAALRRWTTAAARRLLVPELLALSERTGGAPRRVQIRAQRTRWGSCSATGTITLNRSLLFLPWRLTEYVMLHELVHQDCLDHSPRFWRRLETLAPGCRASRRELAEAWRFVPPWALEETAGTGDVR